MVDSKRRKLFIFLSVAALLILLLGGVAWMFSNGTAEDDSALTYRLYDENKNLISSNRVQSVVNGVTGVSYIDFTVKATNTGSENLACNVTHVSPAAFNSAITKTVKNAAVGGNVAWTSNLIDVAPFEAPSGTTTFTANVTCSYNPGSGLIYLPQKQGSISLTIRPNPSGGDFTVLLTSGGTGTEYCGDSVCQAWNNEDSASCPEDCTVSANVKFRTQDAQYSTGTAIAYTATCGTALTKHGHSGNTGNLGGNCATNMPAATAACGSGTITKLFDLPATTGWVSGGAAPSLWKPSGVAGRLCVCDDSGSNYQVRRFDTGDSDGTVDLSSTLIDSNKEVSC